MSQVVPKEEAERLAFTYQPRYIRLGISDNAKDFVKGEEAKPNDFKISPLIEQTTGMAELKKKQIESEVEEAVLIHIKSIEEAAYKKAYELGLTEGREKAFEDSKAEILQRLQGLDELLKNMENLRTMMAKENEASIVKLAFEIGKKIAIREIGLNQEPLVTLIRELIDSVKKDDKVILRMSQADSDFVEDLRNRNDDKVDFLQAVKIVPVAEMETGGCILETNFGSVDSTIPERVNRTWNALAAKIPDLRGHNIDLKDSDDSNQP